MEQFFLNFKYVTMYQHFNFVYVHANESTSTVNQVLRQSSSYSIHLSQGINNHL